MKKFLVFSLLLLMALSACASANGTPQDGQYTVEVTLSGGSGRASVASPAKLTVAGGATTATVVWSSPYYEFMSVDGITYYPVNTDGDSTFKIPVKLNEDMAVSAQTVAMSQPHVIDYTLHFDSATLKPNRDRSPLLPLGLGAAAAALVILSSGFIHQKRRDKNRTSEK